MTQKRGQILSYFFSREAAFSLLLSTRSRNDFDDGLYSEHIMLRNLFVNWLLLLEEKQSQKGEQSRDTGWGLASALWSRITKNTGCKYWANCSSICSIAGTAHSFSCSALLARSTALIRSLALLTHSVSYSWKNG